MKSILALAITAFAIAGTGALSSTVAAGETGNQIASANNNASNHMIYEMTPTTPSLAVAVLESEKNTKRPIVFAHGGAMGSWDFEEYFMPYFFEKGHNVYALNWRGHGKSQLDKDYHSVVIADNIQDLKNVVEYAKERSGKDPIIAGHSQGSIITQLYMKKYQTDTAVLIAMGDFSGALPSIINFYISRFPEGKKKVEAGDMSWFSTGEEFMRAFMFGEETNPKMTGWIHKMALQGVSNALLADLAATYKIGDALGKPKVLLVTGKQDPATPKSMIDSTIDAYDAEHVMIDDMYHGIPTSKNWKKAADAINNWLEN
ncbi:MAG: alpha/beta hydrolase [Hyphomicrobiales bacterium]|nr:alpha/beta hydrolase [Hyphomicrobiales bacterium]